MNQYSNKNMNKRGSNSYSRSNDNAELNGIFVCVFLKKLPTIEEHFFLCYYSIQFIVVIPVQVCFLMDLRTKWMANVCFD